MKNKKYLRSPKNIVQAAREEAEGLLPERPRGALPHPPAGGSPRALPRHRQPRQRVSQFEIFLCPPVFFGSGLF